MQTLLEQMSGQPSASYDDLFTVIKHQQQVLLCKELWEQFHRMAFAMLTDAKCARDRVYHTNGVGERREIDKADPIGERILLLESKLESQAGFTTAARSGQGQQASPHKERLELFQLMVSPHKTRQRKMHVLPQIYLAKATSPDLCLEPIVSEYVPLVLLAHDPHLPFAT